MKAVYPKMQSSHLIKQEKFYIITTLLLQCFLLLEINHASFTKVKAKAESEIWFSSWVSRVLPDSLCNGKPGDRTQEEWQCYIVGSDCVLSHITKVSNHKIILQTLFCFLFKSSSWASFTGLLPVFTPLPPSKPISASHFRHFLFNLELQRWPLSISTFIYFPLLLHICCFFFSCVLGSYPPL